MGYIGEDLTYDQRLQKEFEEMLPRAEGWMEAFVQDLAMRLPSTGNIHRKYLWTSPVFWAEEVTVQLKLKEIFSWVRDHKIWAVLTGIVGFIAAVLTILSLMGLLSPPD
jgi:hypothetical protein